MTSDSFRRCHDSIPIPTVWVAFALSLVLHALLLLGWLPKMLVHPFQDPREGTPSGALAVRLSPPPSPAAAALPSPMAQAQPAPAQRPRTPAAARQAPSAPRLLALERAPRPAPAPPPPDSARPPASEDLASYIEARRRAREPVAAPASAPAQPPAESEQERHNRIVAESLGLNRAPSFGADRNQGGGIFQIARMGYDDAEFFFYGWNKAIRRNARQMIEVRRGDNATMELAVVRRMIAIIREHESGDFVWESPRLGRDVTLSARMGDNAGLEDFMLREFFTEARARR